jgi:hypothetical protein
MHSIFRSTGLGRGVAFLGFGLAASGCSCGGGSMIVQVPSTVSLPISTVVVPQDGSQVIVPINITSTSETALLAVSGLPSGLPEKYVASDTNPSGSLVFTASTATPAGTYTPTVTVGLRRANGIDELHCSHCGDGDGKHNRFAARCCNSSSSCPRPNRSANRRLASLRPATRPASAGCTNGERSC